MNAPAGPPLVETKLRPPDRRAGLVSRPDLVARLDAATDRHRLTLVSAAAGWGKTTLVGDWLAGTGRPAAWVALDSSDNDPARFWRYVSEALSRAGVNVDDQAVGALSGGGETREAGLAALLNAMDDSDTAATIAFDDYHVISEPAIHEAVAFLVQHLPGTLPMVMTSRTDPPIGLARLRARGDLGEIRSADLRFSDGEARSLLNHAIGLDLDADQVGRLRTRTEGWAAGLYLAGLSLRGRDDASAFIDAFAGDDRMVVDYLAAEVLEGQTPERRRFLLRTAILNRLTGPLCDAVAQTSDSAQTLVELERSNLFLVPPRQPAGVVPLPPPLRRAASPRAAARGTRGDRRSPPPGGRVAPGPRDRGRRDPARGGRRRPRPRRRPDRGELGRLPAQRLDHDQPALAEPAPRRARPGGPAPLPHPGLPLPEPRPPGGRLALVGRRGERAGGDHRAGRRAADRGRRRLGPLAGTGCSGATRSPRWRPGGARCG